MRAKVASMLLVGVLFSLGPAAIPSAAAEEKQDEAPPLTVTYYYLPG